jgi:hypothetical protein
MAPSALGPLAPRFRLDAWDRDEDTVRVELKVGWDDRAGSVKATVAWQ